MLLIGLGRFIQSLTILPVVVDCWTRMGGLSGRLGRLWCVVALFQCVINRLKFRKSNG
ncbi:hypothetical protein [Serratia microhaemolytica]|uniref:hypothetical protein n=1 Tax=Serratia microhaemolytica TaxID=2675110 RepID=UPI0012D7BE88|nr:hypothetical protein [Serratia microhaemolytica]